MARKGKRTNRRALRRYQTMVDAQHLPDVRLRKEARQMLAFAKSAIMRLVRMADETDDPLMLLNYAQRIRAVAERGESILDGKPPTWATLRELAAAEAVLLDQELHPAEKRTELRISASSPVPHHRIRSFRSKHWRAIARDPLGITLIRVPEYYAYWSGQTNRQGVRRLTYEFYDHLRAQDVEGAHELLSYYKKETGA